MQTNPEIFSFNFKDFEISKEDIVRTLHGGLLDESHQFYIDILDEILLHMHDYSGIQGGYVVTDDIIFDATNRTIQVIGYEFNVGKIVFNELKPSKKIIVFACTAGKPICDWAKEEYKTDILKGFLIESLANVVVESAMDIIQERMRMEYKKEHLLVSNRYSPGYCNWNVAEQHKLFKILPEKFCGISLSVSALMNPIKSISGFIGIGENIKYNHYKCRFCTQKQCIYKKLVPVV